MKKNRQFRQGDVLIRQLSDIPTSARLQAQQNNRIVLAYGEVTGHAHAINDFENVDVYVGERGELYLRVKNSVDLVHDEHGTITLPSGNYERILQREYSPQAIRNVAD